MRTPKIEALHRLIEWFNHKHNYNIPLLGIDTSNLSQNAWLAGFLDADCNFYFNYGLNKNGFPLIYNIIWELVKDKITTEKVL